MSSVPSAAEPEPPSSPWYPSLFHLLLAALLVLCLGMYLAPRIFFVTDFSLYWLPWAKSTNGNAPWEMYLHKFPTEIGPIACNYPPFVPYLLTIAEAIRRITGAPDSSDPAIVYVKLPFLLAHLAGGFVCLWALRPVASERARHWIALAYILCPALFVNAGIWGQADVLLALAVVSTLGAFLRGKPILAGVLFGWVLSIKLQGVVIAPVLLIWGFRRFGAKNVGLATLVAIGTLEAILLPYILNGAGPGVLNAYTGSAAYYPYRQVNMPNGWFLLDMFEYYAHGSQGIWLHPDTDAVLGPITWRHLGLFVFAAYQIALCTLVARRPLTNNLLIMGSALSVFSFTMLPTQMHERYLLPSVAIAALGIPQSRMARILFGYLSLSLALDQYIVVIWTNGNVLGTNTHFIYTLRAVVGIGLAIGYIALFLWTSSAFVQETKTAA